MTDVTPKLPQPTDEQIKEAIWEYERDRKRALEGRPPVCDCPCHKMGAKILHYMDCC